MTKAFLYLLIVVALIITISLTFNFVSPWVAWLMGVVALVFLFRAGDKFINKK